jgi:hypothetical protein
VFAGLIARNTTEFRIVSIHRDHLSAGNIGTETLYAASLAFSVGLLMWYAHTRPSQILAICQSRSATFTSKLEEGIERVRKGVTTNCADNGAAAWDEYNKFL